MNLFSYFDAGETMATSIQQHQIAEKFAALKQHAARNGRQGGKCMLCDAIVHPVVRQAKQGTEAAVSKFERLYVMNR